MLISIRIVKKRVRGCVLGEFWACASGCSKGISSVKETEKKTNWPLEKCMKTNMQSSLQANVLTYRTGISQTDFFCLFAPASWHRSPAGGVSGGAHVIVLRNCPLSEERKHSPESDLNVCCWQREARLIRCLLLAAIILSCEASGRRIRRELQGRPGASAATRSASERSRLIVTTGASHCC